jgi:hypothetical protein
MAMQTDVKVSAPLTGTGAFTDNAGSPANLTRCRIKAIYASASSSGTLKITDGGSGGAILLPTVAIAAGTYLLLPGEGILVGTSPYGTIGGSLTVSIVYG